MERKERRKTDPRESQKVGSAPGAAGKERVRA